MWGQVKHTFPTYDELRSVIKEHVVCDYSVMAWEGNYIHFLCQPNVSQSSALLDNRTGQMSFLGTESTSGVGQMLVPEGSTHAWSVLGGDPAAGPHRSFLFRDSELYWFISSYDFEDQVMAELLQTDILHSFAQCGDYSVVIFPYTPTVDLVDPYVAKAVVMINGTCGEPWNDQPVPVDDRAWGSLKSLFR